jgi:prophage maintenance system killer protein
MEHTASDGKTYKTQYYNLDAIIAIGYRVNSKKATHFRIWATTKLRDHILKGYTTNEQRLKENSQAKLKELESTIKLFQKAIEAKRLSGYEKELLNIITDYTKTWILLNKYDNDNFTVEDVNKKIVYTLDYEKIKQSIEQFKIRLIKNKEATEIFGREVDYKLKALLGNIEQTFDNQTVYQSIEEKAAHLFYFAIKDHPFADGNKRIGALLFLLYLIENHHFYNKKGDRLIPDTTLTTLALLVAESDPNHKDIIIKLVINLIKK